MTTAAQIVGSNSIIAQCLGRFWACNTRADLAEADDDERLAVVFWCARLETKLLPAPLSAHHETLSRYCCRPCRKPSNTLPSYHFFSCCFCPPFALTSPLLLLLTLARLSPRCHALEHATHTHQLATTTKIRHHDLRAPQTPEEDRALQRQLLRSMHPWWHHRYLSPCIPERILTDTTTTACGPTHTAVTPLDLVKCRRQVDAKLYKSNFQAWRSIMAKEGLRGIFFGWVRRNS